MREHIRSKKVEEETVYCITSLPPSKANAEKLGKILRGHWQIEAMHHIRDVTFSEDLSQTRVSNGPQIMATLRNIAINSIRMLTKDADKIAKNIRRFSFGNKVLVMKAIGLIP